MRTRILLCSGLLILTILAPLSWANAGLPAAGQHLDSQSPETLSASQAQLPELPQVGVGTVHTCGRRPDGTLLCWRLCSGQCRIQLCLRAALRWIHHLLGHGWLVSGHCPAGWHVLANQLRRLFQLRTQDGRERQLGRALGLAARGHLQSTERRRLPQLCTEARSDAGLLGFQFVRTGRARARCLYADQCGI